MRKYCLVRVAVSIWLFALMTTGSPIAFAGVVINETETITGQPPQTRQRIIMIEGNQEKMIDGRREFITDLDKGTTAVIDPAHKMYLEIPFPPQGMMGQAVGGLSEPADYVATGNTRTVAGYKCDEFKGAGQFAIGEFSTISCVSKTAPGVAAYTSFEKAMLAKIKNGPPPNSVPDGIPLTQDTTTTLKPAEIPNLSPQAAEELKRQLAEQPPMVTTSEVTKVEAQKIAASELEVPAGYIKREPPARTEPPAGTGHSSSAGEPSASMPQP